MNFFGILNRQTVTSLKLQITVVVEADGDDSYHAFTPALKGLHADGNTEEEAVRNIADALPAYFRSLAKHGDPLPIGQDCTVHVEREPVAQIPIPAGAFLHHVMLQWPSLRTFGIS